MKKVILSLFIIFVFAVVPVHPMGNGEDRAIVRSNRLHSQTGSSPQWLRSMGDSIKSGNFSTSVVGMHALIALLGVYGFYYGDSIAAKIFGAIALYAVASTISHMLYIKYQGRQSGFFRPEGQPMIPAYA